MTLKGFETNNIPRLSDDYKIKTSEESIDALPELKNDSDIKLNSLMDVRKT